MENIPEKKIEKLIALIIRGVGGEKVNAEKILRELCEKYDLIYDDLFINYQTPQPYRVKVSDKKERQLFCQVVYAYTDVQEAYSNKQDPRYVMFTAIPHQYLELMGIWPIFQRAFRKEKMKMAQTMIRAFIYANKIYRKKTDDEPAKLPSLEEIEAHFQAIKFAQNIDRVQIRKQLN